MLIRQYRKPLRNLGNRKTLCRKGFCAGRVAVFWRQDGKQHACAFFGSINQFARIGWKLDAGLTGHPNEANLQLLWNPNSLRSKSRSLNPSTSSSVTNSECAPAAYAGCEALPERLKMKLIPIQVECYAGTKADETPRRFFREEQPVEVEEVLDRWHQAESKPEWPRADYFKVRGADGHAYLLKHDLEADEWFLGRRW